MKNKFSNIYFIGIGGIGMSALARYFKHEGYNVAGYDRTSTPLTDSLSELGVEITFDESVDAIPNIYTDKQNTMVVYTPAIPNEHPQLQYYLTQNFEIVKRSKMLGVLSEGKFLMAVAGTHGKTTTSSMLSHFHHVATSGGGSAFLGGILKNYESNLILGSGDRLTVEADEFDRSFLQLYPNVALVTSVDADHLDIYSSHEDFKSTFTEFTSQIKHGGTLIYRKSIDLEVDNKNICIYSYSLDEDSDFKAQNIVSCEDGTYRFDIVCPDRIICNCRTGVVGLINVENCVGAVAMLWAAGGYDEDKLREAIRSFSGVKRRFDMYINTPKLLYMDDYAHHPRELKATISSIKALFPNRKITAVFQPHLYTRTRDFYMGFAESLSLCDKVILLPIYPARELPIEGIESEIILSNLTCEGVVVQKENLVDYLTNQDIDILITFGAGNIDALCKPISKMLEGRL